MDGSERRRRARTLTTRLRPRASSSPAARSDELWTAWATRLAVEAPVETVFDVGANRGQTIKWFRPLFPEATIHAFEPFPAAFDDLVAATAEDPLVRPVQVALGTTSGEQTLYINSADTTNSLLENSEKTGLYTPANMAIPQGETRVPMQRLDAYCEQHGVERIDVLKLDVQGYERQVLEGAGQMLHPSRTRGLFLELLFVEYYKDQCWGDELLAMTRERGYRLFGFAGVSFDEDQGWRWSDAMFVVAD